MAALTTHSKDYSLLTSTGNAVSNVTSLPSDILQRLNTENVILLLPVILYVMFSVILGILGNSMVCYVYAYRLRRSPSRIFILFLAVLDLVSCVVGSASELSDLFQPYVFTATWSCKILRFGLSFTIIAASFILTCVAFDRYYKVCKPLNSFPIRKVKTLCITVAVLSLVLASPALAIFGLKTVDTGVAGVTGTECSTADSMKGTIVPIAYYIVLFTAFIILLACFVLLYVRIGLEIWKRKRLTIGETLPSVLIDVKVKSVAADDKFPRAEGVLADEMSNPSFPTEDYSESRGVDNPAEAETDSCLSSSATRNNVVSIDTNNAGPRPVTLRRRKSNLGRMSIRTLRTTSIFFAVSAAFVISFLPYLIANVLKFTKIAFYDIQTSSEEIGYNFCVRSYFISNFINPIIYSALNINFRRECKKLLKRMLLKVKSLCACKE